MADERKMRVCVLVMVLGALWTAHGAPPPAEVTSDSIDTPDLPVPPLPASKPELQCRRHPLTVNFTQLGWASWVLAPQEYDAGYCAGDCSALPNASNHAIVQWNSRKVQDVPAPCCVPTELEPVTLLYLSEYHNVVLKNYKEMKVKSCGCR